MNQQEKQVTTSQNSSKILVNNHNVYICLVILAHYDKPDPSPDRTILDFTVEPHIVEAASEEAAKSHIKELYLYNKQYFEYMDCSILRITNECIDFFTKNIFRKYSDIPLGQKYRIVSEDVFVKGAESWDGNNDWTVVQE